MSRSLDGMTSAAPFGRPESFAFVFVCQAGRLQVDALLLALSLRHFAGSGPELIAAVPTPPDVWGSPQPRVLQELERLDVRVVRIANPIGPDYPIGNKIPCLGVGTARSRLVLLDSDLVCMRDFVAGDDFAASFSAKPADGMTFGEEPAAWQWAYASVGLQPPETRVRATVTGQAMPLYFNAGVVSVRSDCGFGDAWLSCCLAIDADPRVHHKRPWLDQIALPIAARMLDLDIGLLTETHNFPGHLRRVDDRDPPVLCHYHDPQNLLTSRHGAAVLCRLVDDCPALFDLMSDEPSWSRVARRLRPALTARPPSAPGASVRRLLTTITDRWHARRMPDAERARCAVVTGLPRSGTSLFCALVNTLPNAVCLNEITMSSSTWGSYRRIRRRIAAGLDVPNRFTCFGEIATDTAVPDVRVARRTATVVDDGFVLATKFTLPYLNRLEELCERGIRPWVIVRHPLFTIASWRRAPAHFGIAQIDPPGPPLAHIPLTRLDDDERRVEIWNHYARQIDRLRDGLEVIRYEDLVDDPSHALGRFAAHYGLEMAGPPPPLSSRNLEDAQELTPRLVELVTARCEMRLFGYEGVSVHERE